ncbi:MAG: hypothetical protein HN507_01945 [Flavobacteriaceae bacterium]|jgi:hypothetical protein|nr:hypothetical protein [Flavobacteriaceae bacterium]
MKTIKILFYSLLISTIALTSCTNDNSIEVPDMQESRSTQLALNHLINLYTDNGTAIESMNPTGHLIFDFCFEFVYPINLLYNNGSIITITSNEELIEVLINMSDQLHIVGIEFPFNVKVYNPETNEIQLLTITNEIEFTNLLASCFFDNPCECGDEFNPVCIEIIEDNQPITVTFPNPCYAACEGFTVEDFVDCENDNTCDISELEIEVGECNNDETYQLTINFEYENTNGQVYFDLYDRNDEFLGYFLLSALPLTIENFPLSGYEEDYLKVCINDNTDCCEEIEWTAPDCIITVCDISELEIEVGEYNNDETYQLTINFEYESTNGQEYFDLYVRNGVLLGYFRLSALPLTIENFPLSGYEEDYIKVCMNDIADCCEEIEWQAPNFCSDDCYQYVFPIQMSLNGNVVGVGSNEHVDYKLDLGYELIYPIELIINDEIITVYQGILEGVYGERCD